jgi:hypothetical protein
MTTLINKIFRRKGKYQVLKRKDPKTKISWGVFAGLSIFANHNYINRLINSAEMHNKGVEGYEKRHALDNLYERYGFRKNDEAPLEIELNEWETSSIGNAIFREMINLGYFVEEDNNLFGIQDELFEGESIDINSDPIQARNEIMDQIDEYNIAFPDNKFKRFEKVNTVDLLGLRVSRTQTIPAETSDELVDLIRAIAKTKEGKRLHDKLKNYGMRTSVLISWSDEI